MLTAFAPLCALLISCFTLLFSCTKRRRPRVYGDGDSSEKCCTQQMDDAKVDEKRVKEVPRGELKAYQMKDLLLSTTELGQGAFGEVLRGKLMKESRELAINKPLDSLSRIDLENEIRIFQLLPHNPRVVEAIGKVEEDDDTGLYLLMESALGSLKQYLYDQASTPEKISWEEKGNYALDVGLALEFLHQHGIVHRDVCLRNILRFDNLAKLSDFGKSTEVDESTHLATLNLDFRWMPKEYFSERKFDTVCEAYSYGLLIWEIAHDGVLQPYEIAEAAATKTFFQIMEAAKSTSMEAPMNHTVPTTAPDAFKEVVGGLTRWIPEGRMPLTTAVETLTENFGSIKRS